VRRRASLGLILAVLAAAYTSAAVRAGDPPAAQQHLYDDMWPSWSPDGTRVAFMSTRDGDPDIYVMNRDGSAPRRLTTAPGRDAHPFWSPDGTRIVFQSPREEGQTRLFVMNADGSAQRALTANRGFCGMPAWSPDGRHILFQCSDDAVPPIEAPWHGGAPDIYRLTVAGGDLRRLTRLGLGPALPWYSPDGSTILFQRRVDDGWRIWMMGADGSNPRPIALAPDVDFRPADMVQP
jgi:TolB protein